MTALYAEFEAKQGSEQTVADLVRRLTEEVRREEGNVFFLPHRHSDQAARWFVYELYSDEAAFAAHLAQGHTADFNLAIAPHIVGGVTQLSMLIPPWPE